MCVFGPSVRMQVCFLLLLIQLHITEGCKLERNAETTYITAYTGDSVLLPCSCTDLHTTPEIFTWEKYTTNENKWVKISPESEQYKERFQLVNDRSSGNLSLLISHLTEEDGEDYMCSVKGGQYRYIRLTVKGCTLDQPTVTVTGYVGQSVLLPCSCSELQAKPRTVIWTFSNGSDHKEIFPKDQTNLYTDRVQLVNDHLPGNLSLLISHLTVEDGGDYKCRHTQDEIRDIRLIVKACTLKQPTVTVTGYMGQSVLLPCSCSDLQAKPHTVIWKILHGPLFKEIFPKDQTNLYTDRVQLFNDHLPGNLSLLISHLTVEDGGDYRCRHTQDEIRDIILTVKGCTLDQPTVTVTGYVGQSVLLPCSCSELQAKPRTVTWTFSNGSDHKEIFPKDQTNLYTDRVQLVNDHLPGNLSLLISNLTEEDGGDYKCRHTQDEIRDIRLIVKACTLKQPTVTVTGYVGQSVLLPCSCSDLQAKPRTVIWKNLHGPLFKEIFPKDQTNLYTDRIQLFNDHLPGNLSLLISHLTVEDGGYYRCRHTQDEFRDIILTVKACTLKQPTVTVTGYVGQSVLLPCSCSDLQAKPHTITWSFLNGSDKEIFPKDQTNLYTDRVQLFNYHLPGNLSLLISHLTEEDGGVYRCRHTQDEIRDIRLTVKACTLNQPTVTGYVGQSVLLPCSCSEQQAKPRTVIWKISHGSLFKEIFPKDQTNLYTDRVQLVNDHLPGNLSLLISHLTEEDGGWYRCEIRDRISDVRLIVRERLPYIPFGAVTVFFLHIIVAVVYYTTRKKGPETVHYSRADGDGAVTLPLRTQ